MNIKTPKLRGIKKYFLKLDKLVESTNLSFTENDWYDLWHTHYDWNGYGNKNRKYRNEHLKTGIKVFKKILNQAKMFTKPYQCWMAINKNDSSQDTIYFHTKNPNHDNFPYDLTKIVWSNKIPSLLNNLLKEEEYKYGYWDECPELIWVIEKEIYNSK